MAEKIFIKDLSREELGEWLQQQGAKKYTADQVFEWIYKNRAKSFDEMSNIKKEFRDKLKESMDLTALEPEQKQVSALDGTQKYLVKLKKGGLVESVFLPYEGRITACISSQVGCRQGCTFCATATMGLKRNLSAGEIVEQIMFLEQDTGKAISNIVLMGMGEPLDNFENVRKAVYLLHDKDGLNKGSRKVTLSTCGLVPEIEKIAEENWPVSLAISLNAPEDSLRSRIMPINRRYPLKQLLEAAKKYTTLTGKFITFEYVLIAGVNDSPEQARLIPPLIRNVPCKINLIPFNKVKGKDYETAVNPRVKAFQEELMSRGVHAFIREKGDDIDAACGQLRVLYQNHKQPMEATIV